MKESITGYMDRTLEGGKLENMIYTQIGDVYYLPEFGIDREVFLSETYPVQNQAFESYIRQMAMVNQILTSKIEVTIEDFTAKINYIIANESSQSNTFNTGIMNV